MDSLEELKQKIDQFTEERNWNQFASSSNIIATIVTKDASSLDIGGFLVTIYRVFNDTRFISKLEHEFLIPRSVRYMKKSTVKQNSIIDVS